ncbi:MAG TPA: FAD-dependent monooxygenase [Allosphingosinicella sp.]|jgi:flavin-dependent dehydrogenase
MRRTAALIAGAGPAGCAAAIVLARGGLSPLLVERSEGPRDVVCGGFLGWDALAALRHLGIDPQALGAQPIDKLRLVTARGRFEAPLPHAAAGLSRRTLDEALQAAAVAGGAELLRGRAIRAAEPDLRRLRLEDGEELEGEALLIATGKHELRGAERGVDLARAPLGLRASVAGAADLKGFIELHLFDGGYSGALMQEDGTTNLCLSVSRARLKQAGGVEPLLAELSRELPALGRRLEGGALTPWSAVAGVPYGWRAAGTGEGVYRVGDQAAVIASLAGDGVAIALASGIAAGEAMLAGRSAPAYQHAFSARARRPLGIAESLRRAAERPAPRTLLMPALRLFPGLAPLFARLTRIGH